MRLMYPAATAALLIGASAHSASTNVPAQQSTIQYSTTGGVTSYFGNYARATSTVVYDPVANTYTIRDTGSLTTKSTFGPTGVVNGNFTVYTKSPSETFRVLNQAAVNLTYVDFGEWKRSSTANATTSVNDTYLVWGTKTARNDLPLSGSASYSTIYDGNFVDKNGEHALNGSGGITANFGAGTLSYTANINGVPVGPLAFAGNGTINSRQVGFTTSNTSSGYTLNQYGNFYGPQAAEVGGLFRLYNRTGNGQGAFAGHQ
ncbi:MAG TPA: hypothetical protein VK192_01005 [Sphingomicrobium sp.]|nr:hypothetical protein [Sphingomicrobium sp.]